MCIRDSSSIDQRIDYRWIDLRTDENQLMFKAQSCFVNAMRKFLLDRNFIEIHTPKPVSYTHLHDNVFQAQSR